MKRPKRKTRAQKVAEAKRRGLGKMPPALQRAGKLPKYLVEELNDDKD